MSPGELKSTREYLGLSTAWMADRLVIGQRRIDRMEAGKERIPEFIVSFIDEIHAKAKSMVEQKVAVYRRRIKTAEGRPVPLPTYRTDAICEAAGNPYPSRFYRHIAARVADAAPGAIIVYTGEDENSESDE